ncbi:Nn.00g105380.m01.CDS01 [Neocucurbitaria sp. VM-36]
MTADDGRSYVLVEKLQKWMRDTSLTKLGNNFVTNTDLLAHAAYSDRDFPPIVPSRISDAGADCCLIVFSILLDLELGHLIDLFSKKMIVDRRLPEDLLSLKKKLQSLPDGEHVAERFNQRQWKFCPAIFSLNMENEYFEDRIIPICRKTSLNSGGTAHVWQIVVQEEFVDRKLRNLLAEDAFASYDDKDYGPCYIFALKTFEEGRFQYYHDEKAAFDGLRKNRGVIRRLGCYSHRILHPSSSNGQVNGERQSVQGKNTMNLLLEYGTYDLRLIFGHVQPPVFPKEILGFWEALFEVADAVYGIHEFTSGGSAFNGWHADIKPENIIFVRGKYKLADPGFARFKKKAADKGATPQIRLHGGTNTYGAPEVFSQATVHQTIDTWSLGYVFSMAATWLILGYQRVCQYQIVREKALGSLLKAIKEDGHPLLVSQRSTVDAKPEKVDCFHNGTDVLTEITSWHTLLRSSARKTDPITEKVLDLIDREMLLKDPNKRMGSKNLCAELKRIVGSSNKVLCDNIAAESPEARVHRERMEGLLYEIDKEAATPIFQKSPPEPTRPFAAGLPKTSHRFETIPDPRSTPNVPEIIGEKPTRVTSDTMSANEVLQRSGTQPDYTAMPVADRRKSFRKSTFGQPSRANTGTTNLAYQKTGLQPPTHATQNVIQARESMDRDSK